MAVSKIDLRHLSDNTDSTRIRQKRRPRSMFFCRGRRQMNFKSSVIIFVCDIRVFRIFKTNPYQNVIQPYNTQIINNPYRPKHTGNPYHVAGLSSSTTDHTRICRLCYSITTFLSFTIHYTIHRHYKRGKLTHTALGIGCGRYNFLLPDFCRTATLQRTEKPKNALLFIPSIKNSLSLRQT